MNKIELIKKERPGLDIINDIDRFAKEGWDSISEDDIQRLKWHGLFLRNPTPGFFMLRVRIPNGHSFSHQVKALATISETFGNGVCVFPLEAYFLQIKKRNYKNWSPLNKRKVKGTFSFTRRVKRFLL